MQDGVTSGENPKREVELTRCQRASTLPPGVNTGTVLTPTLQPNPRTMAAKKTQTAKKTTSKAPASMPKPPAKDKPRKRVDPAKLEGTDAKKRCAQLYKLDDEVEELREKWQAAKRRAKSAKNALDDKIAERDSISYEHRFGSGPLVDMMEEGAK